MQASWLTNIINYKSLKRERQIREESFYCRGVENRVNNDIELVLRSKLKNNNRDFRIDDKSRKIYNNQAQSQAQIWFGSGGINTVSEAEQIKIKERYNLIKDFTQNRGVIEEISRENREKYGLEEKEKTLIFSKFLKRWVNRDKDLPAVPAKIFKFDKDLPAIPAKKFITNSTHKNSISSIDSTIRSDSSTIANYCNDEVIGGVTNFNYWSSLFALLRSKSEFRNIITRM
jgi:hypothetical protein